MTQSPIKEHLVVASDHASFKTLPNLDEIHVQLEHTLQYLCEEANESNPSMSYRKSAEVQPSNYVCDSCRRIGERLDVLRPIELRVAPDEEDG